MDFTKQCSVQCFRCLTGRDSADRRLKYRTFHRRFSLRFYLRFFNGKTSSRVPQSVTSRTSRGRFVILTTEENHQRWTRVRNAT